MRTFLSLHEPYPIPRAAALTARRINLQPMRPWVAHLTPTGRAFEPHLLNHTPTGVRWEYYPNVPEGHTIEINAPTSWCASDRYRLTRRGGRLTRE